jgi:5-oxoprolinase (ATP-hydrolysing) subunit A
MAAIDLNSDLGESYGPWVMGQDRAMLAIVTSANIACGGHAGDPDVMFATLTEARARGVVVGAHPGYDDRAGFGRRVIPMTGAEIARMVAAQIGALMGVAALAGVRVAYVKPHGALANLAADDRTVADAIAGAVRAIDPTLAVLAISGTELEPAARGAGLQVFSEVFADRAYLPSGRLVPRGQAGAMIIDPAAAAARMQGFIATGLMPVVGGPPIRLAGHSVCVHGDSPHAVAMAGHLHKVLTEGGTRIAPFLQPG